MANQEQTLMLKRVASEFLKVVDPISGKITNFAPLGFAFEKALAIWRAKNLFAPLKILEDGGTLSDVATAIFHIPTVPKTTDYDWKDWNWEKIPGFAARTVQLDLDGSYRIRLKRTWGDMRRLHNLYKSGDYASVAGFFEGLVKEMTIANQVKQASLIMEEMVKLAKDNGITNIKATIKKGTVLTSYLARKLFFSKILDVLANFKKALNQTQGHMGTSGDDYVLLISENKFYDFATAMGVQGSDQAYRDLLAGSLTNLWVFVLSLSLILKINTLFQ